MLEGALAWRQDEAERLDRNAHRIYAERTPEAWRAAFAEGARTRVLLATSRFTTVLQYVTRDLE